MVILQFTYTNYQSIFGEMLFKATKQGNLLQSFNLTFAISQGNGQFLRVRNIQNIKMRKNQLLNSFIHLDQVDWSIIKEHNMVRAINNYTSDCFTYLKFEEHSRHLVEAYQARSFYKMPNTPQIIMASLQQTKPWVQMLVEQGMCGVEKFIKPSTCGTGIKDIINILTQTIQHLISKFGFFQLTPSMIRVTNSSNLLVWMNQNFSKMQPQFPIRCINYSQGCKILILSLLLIFEDAGAKKLLLNLRRKVEQQVALTFEKFKIFIEENLYCINKEPKSGRHIKEAPTFLLRSLSQKAMHQKHFFLNNSSRLSKPRPLRSTNSPKKQQSLLNTSKTNRRQRTELNQHSVKLLKKNSLIIGRQNSSIDKKKENLSHQKLKDLNQQQNSLLTATNYTTSIQNSGIIPKIQEVSLVNSQRRRPVYEIHESIIEDKNQQVTTPNTVRDDKVGISMKFSDFQSEFHNVLNDRSMDNVRHSTTTISQLETELNKLLHQ